MGYVDKRYSKVQFFAKDYRNLDLIIIYLGCPLGVLDCGAWPLSNSPLKFIWGGLKFALCFLDLVPTVDMYFGSPNIWDFLMMIIVEGVFRKVYTRLTTGCNYFKKKSYTRYDTLAKILHSSRQN